jgi:hypothetical protein
MPAYPMMDGNVLLPELDAVKLDGLPPFSVETLRAMHAALERLDPALIPGLTAAERSALSRYARPAAEQPRRVRHKKRGSVYDVLGEGEVQISRGHGGNSLKKESRRLVEGDTLTVYQGTDGKLWLRFPDEFNDGRFEELKDDVVGTETETSSP